MAVWKHMRMFFKNASCPVRWKLIVYSRMIRSKLSYGLETVELTQSLLSRLERFQLTTRPSKDPEDAHHVHRP